MFITEDEYYDTIRKEVLDESAFATLVTKAATLLGYSGFAGLAGLGACLVAKSTLSKQGKVRKFFTKIFKKKDDNFDFEVYKNKTAAKREDDKVISWKNRLADVYKAIELKDWDEARARFEESKFAEDQEAIKAIIIKVTDVLGEPPLFVYPSGSPCYFALKKVIGIKYAKAAADAVLAALRQNKSYYENIQGQDLQINKGEING